MEVASILISASLALSATLLKYLAGGDLVLPEWARDLLRRIGIELPEEKATDSETPYAERLALLTSSLATATKEVDSILAELAAVARDRTAAIVELEEDLRQKSALETELQQRIDQLQSTPIQVADYFASIVSTGEKRSANRDYLLFGSGVLVSTVVAVAIQLLAG